MVLVRGLELFPTVVEPKIQTARAEEAVREAVENLPECERDVIRGRYWEGWSFRKIAGRLGKDHKTVVRWHDSALKGIRRVIAA